VPNGRSPEEFFEVFREVQASKRKREEKPAAPPETPAPPAEEAPARSLLSRFRWPAEGALTVSYPVVGAAAVVLLLVAVGGYLLGRQQGWHAHAAWLAHKAAPKAAPATSTGAVASEEPEYVEGKVFTLLVSGNDARARASSEQEAKYLNNYAPFKALQVQAYVWRDKSGSYRVCARGLGAMGAASRENVKTQVRKLRSRFGKHEYQQADFYAP